MASHFTPTSDQSHSEIVKVPDVEGINSIEFEDEFKGTIDCVQDRSAVFTVFNADNFDEPSQDRVQSHQLSTNASGRLLRSPRISENRKVRPENETAQVRSHTASSRIERKSIWNVVIDCLRRKTEPNTTRSSVDISPSHHRSVPEASASPIFETQGEAAAFAVHCVERAIGLQCESPPDLTGAGVDFQRAVDAYARAGLFCSEESASAHTAYAQNLSKRGNRVESEYHVRMAADIYRVLNARTTRRYGDCLLHLAGVVDKQGRLEEAEDLFNSALAVYRMNKVFDKNVRMAITGLRKNLCSQGRYGEANMVKQRQLYDATD